MISFPFFIFETAPTLQNTSISAEWVFGICIAVLAFFLHRFVTQIDTLTKQLIAMDKTQISLMKEVESLRDKVNEKLDHGKIAEITIAKLMILQGGSKERDWPFKSYKEANEE